MDGSSSGPFYPPWKEEDVATAAAAASAASVSNESRSQSRGSAYSNESSSGEFLFQTIQNNNFFRKELHEYALGFLGKENKNELALLL